MIHAGVARTCPKGQLVVQQQPVTSVQSRLARTSTPRRTRSAASQLGWFVAIGGSPKTQSACEGAPTESAHRPVSPGRPW